LSRGCSMTRAPLPYRGLTERDGVLPCVLGTQIHLLQAHAGVRGNRIEMDEGADIRTVRCCTAFDHYWIGGGDELMRDGRDDRDHLFDIAGAEVDGGELGLLMAKLGGQCHVVLPPAPAMVTGRQIMQDVPDRRHLYPQRFPEG